ETNFWHRGCWLAFFPKLVSGPIEREGQFFPQMKKLSVIKFWNRGRLSAAFTYMLWGYFMKMVVADRIGPVVGPLFERPGGFDSFWLLLGAFLYSVQIYCDFAGYSYIAVGCAKLFGIEIMENFRSPYMAVDIQDFWRRWHVSLSEWLRDYVYIPLGGNRKGVVRKNLNTMIVFIVCGMWHGAGLNFLAWGVLHGVYSVADSLIKEWNKKGMAEKTPDQRKGTGCKRVITFSLTAFAWIFFRAGSLRSALLYVRHMVTAGFWPKRWAETAQSLQLNAVEISIIGVGMLGVWLVDRLCVREKMNLPMIIQQKTNGTRYFVFYLLLLSIFIFGVYGAGYHTEQFIYMQF
ncbi:MAG: MBOAT family protein, partial [Lachnospiraceae bacterium]|nr:MBOAT family protein [Lachnospiraceae bacterium]